jgi:hypothetical protein
MPPDPSEQWQESNLSMMMHGTQNRGEADNTTCAPSPTPNYNQTDRSNLMPKHKSDTDSLSHLASLGPSIWAPLIARGTASAPASGLLDWVCDINWPVAYPITQLLLTCVNDADHRSKYGRYLVNAVNDLFTAEDDWDWIYWVLVHVVCEIDDKEYVKREFGESLRAMGERVPVEEEKNWEFGEQIAECLGRREKEGDMKSSCRIQSGKM